MVRRRIQLLMASVAIAVLSGGGVAALAGAGAAHGRAHPTGRATVPSVRAVPATCLIAGQTCSIHPCVEYVAPRSPRLLRARMACAMYPSVRAQALPIRR